MSNKNEQNINISNASNIAIGDISMNVDTKKDAKGSKVTTHKDNALAYELKSIIGNGKLKEAIDKLLIQFKEINNGGAINKVIMQATALAQLELQENIGVIPHEQATIDRARISNALLHIIDDEIV